MGEFASSSPRWRSVRCFKDETFDASPALAALIASPSAVRQITCAEAGRYLGAREQRPERVSPETNREGCATGTLRLAMAIMDTTMNETKIQDTGYRMVGGCNLKPASDLSRQNTTRNN